MQEILTSICFLRLQMVTCPFSLVAASHKLQIHVKSVRVLTIKRSQWARKNFAVIVKSDLWKKNNNNNNNFAKDAKILRPSQSIRKQFGQVVEKSFVCHFLFFSFRESNDWNLEIQFRGCVQNVLAKSCLLVNADIARSEVAREIGSS